MPDFVSNSDAGPDTGSGSGSGVEVGPPAVAEAMGVTKHFGATTALRDVNVRVAAGETVALMGPSGSGKSTLLHCLAGILTPDAGTIRTAGAVLTEVREFERSRIRLQRLGFVFQYGDLIPELTLLENVALPLTLLGVPRRKAEPLAYEALDRLGVGPEARRRTGETSGGQAQRAAVARALIHRPQVVFADEPTGSLDVASGEEVLDLLLDTAKADGAAVVIVTHDHRVAAHADRLVTLRDGRIVGSEAG